MIHYTGYSTALNVSILTTGVTLGPPANGPYPGVYCSVYIANSAVLASIFAPLTGRAMSNPFLVNADGSYAFDGSDASFTVVFSITVPADTTPREVRVPSFATASLPTPSSAGRLVRLTDGSGGLVMDSGSAWGPPGGGTTTVPANGGTGITSYAVGDLLVASAAATLARLPVGATGTVLVGGSTPSYSASPTLTSVILTAGSIAASAPAISATQTWSNSGVVFTAVLVNITDNASDAGSFLLNLQRGGSSKFYVDKNGGVQTQGSIAVNGSGNGLQIANNGSFGFVGRANFVSSADGILVLYNNGQNGFTSVRIGGEAATNPALKRDTIFLQLRLGDDSGVSGAATGSLPVAAAARDGIIGFDTTLNALVYYVGGARFKLTGTSF